MIEFLVVVCAFLTVTIFAMIINSRRAKRVGELVIDKSVPQYPLPYLALNYDINKIKANEEITLKVRISR